MWSSPDGKKRWRQYEDNPVLGQHPNTHQIDAYFGIIAAVNVVLWLALPSRYRSLVPMALAAVEVQPIAENLNTTAEGITRNSGVCGL